MTEAAALRCVLGRGVYSVEKAMGIGLMLGYRSYVDHLVWSQHSYDGASHTSRSPSFFSRLNLSESVLIDSV